MVSFRVCIHNGEEIKNELEAIRGELLANKITPHEAILKAREARDRLDFSIEGDLD